MSNDNPGKGLKKDKTGLSHYFEALKDSPLLDKIEADSKRVRAMARPMEGFKGLS